ncbi:MAG: vitamin K epoxide reductase family protein [Sandaracinaceae bacterium]
MRPGPAARASLVVLRLASLAALFYSTLIGLEYLQPEPTFCGPGGGCETVKASTVGRWIGSYLPVIGLVGYGAIFTGSLATRRSVLRTTAILAVLGAVGAAAFLVLQGAVIGAFCELCVGVDLAAIVAGAAGVAILAWRVGEEPGSVSVASPWWAAAVLALGVGPAYLLTFPDPPVPQAVRAELTRDAVDVIELVDFECPYCRRLHPVLMEALDGSDQPVRVVRWMVPLSFHVHARGAAGAFVCAEQQGKAEVMADHLFTTDDLSVPALRRAVEDLGLDPEAFEACWADDATWARIGEDVERARAALPGGISLPTVWIEARKIVGAQRPPAYRSALAEASAGRRVRYWPFALLAAIALVLLVWARPRVRPASAAP